MISYCVFKQVNKKEQVHLKELKDYEYPTWQLSVVPKQPPGYKKIKK